MAIKSRLLSKLKFIYMTTTMAAAAHPQKLRPALHNLEEARELCQQGLTESNYAKYGEVYEGLIMAVKQILSGEAGKDAGEIVGLCKELLEHIMAETGKEEHFKKEMVFLPYKASMWDSLESIWKEAAADTEHCHTYVVPITYADRNPDGTAKTWHNEKELFPSYVPTLDCETFDLEALHPDVIFIHNPYDSCNIVSSVDSRFYSDKLKKYTDDLIYVPYFVMEEVRADFCQLPGVVNADHVILDTEKNKKIYEENYPIGKPPEGKFIVLGSPKIKKIENACKEDYPLPLEWEKLIAGRRIILYNTSLSSQLQNPSCIISKLQSVLSFFKHKEDVAFWWRPHPLMEATFWSMIPGIVEDYRQIKEQFIQERWGIYDDTPEMDRAVLWSDAYYGDESSVVSIYKRTGKPIMIQNLKLISET